MGFERARSAPQRESRRRQLVEAATGLFDAEPWDGITVARIAEAAGLAKGTTYRYFATKEAVFLDVLGAELEAWVAGLVADRAIAGRRAVAWHVARTLGARPRLVRLLGLQRAVLEVNVTPEAALAYHRATLAIHTQLAHWVERVAGLAPGDGLRFVARAIALTAGLGGASRPAAAVEQAIASDASLHALRVNFAAELEHCLAALLAA